MVSGLGLLFVMAVAAPPGDDAPRLEMEEGIDCPSRVQVQKALDDRFGSAKPDGGAASALLEVRSDGAGQLTVLLTSATAKQVAEKTLAAHAGTCSEVARTIALLAEGWLRDLAAQEAAAPPVVAPPEPPAPVATSQVTPPPPERGYRPSLAVLLSVDGIGGSQVRAGGSLALEVSLPKRFAIGAGFSLLGSLTGSDPSGGTLTVTRQQASLFATYAVLAPESGKGPTLAVRGGATLFHYATNPQGFPVTSPPSSGFQPGLVFGVRAMQPIFQGFFVYGELDGNALANSLNFQVSGAGGSTTLVTQAAFWGSLSLGLGVHL